MHTYKIQFSGRQVGAIGIFQRFERTVKAPDQAEAMLRLYETHEHIGAASGRPSQIETVFDRDPEDQGRAIA